MVRGVGHIASGKQGSSKAKCRVVSVLVLYFLCLQVILKMTAHSVRELPATQLLREGFQGVNKKGRFCSHAHPPPLHHSRKANEPPSGQRFVQWNCQRKELPELISKNIACLCPQQNTLLAQEVIRPWKVGMWTHKSLGLDLQILTRWGKL